LIGDKGDDSIYGGSSGAGLDQNGNDQLYGGEGNDYLNGNRGNDTLSGNTGDDTLNGGKNEDVLYGGTGNDSINGDTEKDTLIGGKGDDILNGGQGDDLLYGGQGNNTLSGDQGSDRFVLTFEGVNTITDFGNEDALAFVGFSFEEVEFVPNIDENMTNTNIVLNGEILAILKNPQIIDVSDLNFIEYQSLKDI
jgi:Hemolysin-type calcium-binding repeat (2 copies).